MRAATAFALVALLAACEVEAPDSAEAPTEIPAATPVTRPATPAPLRPDTAARLAPPPPVPDLAESRENELPVVEQIQVQTWNAARGAYEPARGPLQGGRSSGPPLLAVVTVQTDPAGTTPPIRLRGVVGGAEVFSETVRLGITPGAESAPFVIPGDQCEPLTLAAPSRDGEVTRTLSFACDD